ncbi:hypothetical protein TMatcc_010141 [Talaromyces marneffei ATCC 18224]
MNLVLYLILAIDESYNDTGKWSNLLIQDACEFGEIPVKRRPPPGFSAMMIGNANGALLGSMNPLLRLSMIYSLAASSSSNDILYKGW